MELLHDRRDRLADDAAVAATIGVFDGVHLGHQEVFRQVRAAADRLGVRSAVVTFDGHPAHVVRPENAPKLLTTLDQKLELIEAQGIDCVYLISFDEDRAATPLTSSCGRSSLRPCTRRRSSSVRTSTSVQVAPATSMAWPGWVSSSASRFTARIDPSRRRGSGAGVVDQVRRALAGGNVAYAASMLGRPYEVRGVVEAGDQRGRQIGFPTANIPVPKVMAWPADAVYAGWCTRENGERHPCAINIGRRPTFYEHAEQSLLEAHLIDFEGDLYGEEVAVSFVDFLRSERKFNGLEQLSEQLKVDIDDARAVLRRMSS